MSHYWYRRIEYSYFSFSKSAEEIKYKWCYSARELQDILCKQFRAHTITAVYVSLRGYINSSHHRTNMVNLSCEAGGCIVVFDNAVLDLGIHAMGQFQYRIVPIEDVTIHTTKDFPPRDYDKLYSAYYDISNHDITVNYAEKEISEIDVVCTDMWCFPLNGFDEEKANLAKEQYDLPERIVLTSGAFNIHIIGDDLEYFRVKIEEKSINEQLLQSPFYIYRVRRLPSREGEKAYVITLLKRTEISVETRIENIYQFFRNALKPGERLETDYRSFRIVGKNYQLVYCIELYKRNANKLGYIEQDEVKTQYLMRMGCDLAFRWLNQHKLSIDDSFVQNKITDDAFCLRYPNPADRFIAIINDYKEHLKVFGSGG